MCALLNVYERVYVRIKAFAEPNRISSLLSQYLFMWQKEERIQNNDLNCR